MLGKATAEFRKMTNDFRFALEDEVRELERQTRIRQEEAAARASAAPASLPEAVPEGAVPRDPSAEGGSATVEPQYNPSPSPEGYSDSPQASTESVSVSHEKPTDDNPAA